MIRKLVASAGVVALLLAACGGGDPRQQVRDVDPFETINPTLSPGVERAAPRWEAVTVLRGSSSDTERVTISEGAIQWRLSWRCDSGTLTIEASPSSGEAALADARCPGSGRGVDVETGDIELDVDATGRWEAVVEQQVDTPLVEDPLPEMEARKARVLARGEFYPIERRGSGEAMLYRLPDGRLAVRLENFETSNNTDLFVWLSRSRRPRTSKQVVTAPHVEIALLKSTIGEHNYLVPKGVSIKEIASVVIWCEPIRIAYTAASLR